MSGHSKWSTIKHKKAKTDAQKGKIFTKIVREITSAARQGGADADGNPRLRLAIEKAKEVNMPADNIKRAVQKGAGAGDGQEFEDILFEAYGPFGVAILINTLTDNRNRTVPNIRSILGKYSGNLAAKGAVSYLFEQNGLLIFEPGASEEAIIDCATEAGAEDVDCKEDGSIEVIVKPEAYEKVKQAFEGATLQPVSSAIGMLPKTSVLLTQDQARTISTLIEKLEDDDDVQDVYSNAQFPDDWVE